MSTTTVLAAAAAVQTPCVVVPMFVCGGCRPEPVGYTHIEFGDALEEIIVCPMREVCTWHAAHDLGGRSSYSDQPEGALLTALFRHDPYFSCPNFHDYAEFLTGSTPPPVVASAHESMERESAPTRGAEPAT